MTQLPAVPHYVPAPPTKENLEWADLPTVDLALAKTPEGKKELVEVVKKAMKDYGFFYVINHGFTQEQTDRIFDIADVPFSVATEADRQKYAAKIKENGTYQGYKPRTYWHIDAGVRDQIENYNINYDVTKREHPEVLRPYMPEIDELVRHNHYNVLHPVLRLLAGAVDLPEETFVNMHNFGAPAESWVRFMKYYPRNEEDERKTHQVWLKGHTDFGSVTILWSQPVSALQVLMPNNTWRWVKHIPNALVVNVGESLEALSGGRLRATIHRVRQPPEDQRGYERLGVFYFATTDDDVRLAPLVSGDGIKQRFTGENIPTMREWASARIRAYGQTQLTKKDGGIEEEFINGNVVRHYN